MVKTFWVSSVLELDLGAQRPDLGALRQDLGALGVDLGALASFRDVFSFAVEFLWFFFEKPKNTVGFFGSYIGAGERGRQRPVSQSVSH